MTTPPSTPLPGVRQGNGEPLLLVHGLGSCWQSWEPVLPLLAAHHDVSAVDLPGFGQAPRPAGPIGPSVLADHLEAHLDALGWDRAHLAGFSLGGLLALRLAARGRARSVTALSPGGFLRGRERDRARLQLRTSRRLARVVAPIAGPLMGSRTLRSIGFAGTIGHPWRITPEAAATQIRAIASAPGFDDVVTSVFGPDGEVAADLPAVAVPTTIVWGTRDRLLSPRQGERFKRARPEFRLVRVPGAGHLPQFDEPERVVQLVLETIGAVRRG